MKTIPKALAAALALSLNTAPAEAAGTPPMVEPKPAAGTTHVLVVSPAATPAEPSPTAAKVVRLDKAPLGAAVLATGKAARPVDLAASPVALRAGEVLVTRTAAAVRQSASAATRKGAVRWSLPYQYRFLDAAKTVRTSHLVAEVGGGGLRMPQTGEAVFSGELFVELEDEQDRARTYPLPVPAHVLVTAPVDRVDPDRFAIVGTNEWVEIRLRTVDPPDLVRASLRASTDPVGLQVEIPVHRPGLTVRVSPERIQGLGLELARIEVVTEGLLQPSGRKVTLVASQGSLAPSPVELDPQGRAQAHIRSVATGTAAIDALSPPLRPAKAAVVFVAPWVFAVAAIFGGIAGAVIRRSQLREKGRRRRVGVREVVTGALVGLLVAVLYAVGVNVLPVTPSATAGEALVFGLAALGGFLGMRVPGAD